MRKIDKIILHCSATKEGQHFTAEDIDCWHKERGFAKIGYHHVVYLDGSVHKGRDESLIGAHCLGQNATSIGVCYIGGLDKSGKPKDTRTANQKRALINLVNDLKAKYPGSRVYGHNEFAAKACPCFDVKKEFRY
ncbi:N-acetylmuramoyl-L-alanine amidase [Prevotella sp. 10(H)]|uniref:N-acetylmuramoyl-L-alanine amidase n=1 Tax=Prevotella sp. 10(H) TaxID=1158294 RepID=UPI0004A714ED|nr:N-acetylmuramoyl-L-alanine amidase [Prevotella sp. 10(H)]